MCIQAVVQECWSTQKSETKIAIGSTSKIRPQLGFLRLSSLLTLALCASALAQTSPTIEEDQAKETPAFCRDVSAPIASGFSDAMSETYRAAYEQELRPVGIPFALFNKPVAIENISDVKDWKACVTIAPVETRQTIGEYALVVVPAQKIVRISCATGGEQRNVCHQTIVAYLNQKKLGVLGTYTTDTRSQENLVMSIPVATLPQ
jgi:hypothetical protein